MPKAIDYERMMTEVVYINLPGPDEAKPGMSGGELLHGFLAELYRNPNPEVKNFIEHLCGKWSVIFRPR